MPLKRRQRRSPAQRKKASPAPPVHVAKTSCRRLMPRRTLFARYRHCRYRRVPNDASAMSRFYAKHGEPPLPPRFRRNAAAAARGEDGVQTRENVDFLMTSLMSIILIFFAALP